MKNNTDSGQVVVIILLVVAVILVIALSIISRSTTEIANSTRSENSSRAFSAAEAGLEKALKESQTGMGGSFSVNMQGNTALANVNWFADIPHANTGFAVPPLGKDEVAQFWLVDPADLSCDTGMICHDISFWLYFGQPINYTGNLDQQPGVELNIIVQNGTSYKSVRRYYDTHNSRPNSTGFTICSGNSGGYSIQVNDGTPESFYCKITVDNYLVAGDVPVMIRARLLFSSGHTIAILPVDATLSIPLQAHILTSEGRSGDSKRVLQIFQQKDVMPQFMDYVLFSTGDLTK